VYANKRLKGMMRWILVACVCLSLLSSVAGYYYWSVMPSNAISGSLADEVHRGPDTVVDFAKVAPFAWDRVFIFPPYTTREQIDSSLGFHWAGARWSAVQNYEGWNLLVFVHDGAVVCWFDHGRLDGDLMHLPDSKGYSRDQARFRVNLSQDQRLLLSK
jgi:hypothetical protein